MKKVIVIGLDGLEPTIVDALLAAGELPNLARLRDRGGYSRIATTTPAQTPVAWSTFATGTNPGGHGIFDFLRRDPATYLPDLGLNRHESRGAFLPPRVVNLRQGETVWELLGKAGIESTILRCPVTYPPDALRGRLLSGMGVPDLRGGFGTPTLYTTDATLQARESESVVVVALPESGPIETHLPGPKGAKGKPDLRVELRIHHEPSAGRAVVAPADGSDPVEVLEGQWSDWLRVRFKQGLLQSVHGMVRFHGIRLAGDFQLYASPVNFDPDAPAFPISHPPEYVSEISAEIGPFHTTGMVEDHTGMMNERLSEAAFLDQCDLAWREREAQMLLALEKFDRGLFFCLFDTPDRVQHLFWRFREPDHPANRDRAFDPTWARAIDDQYRRSDEMVGRALEFADDETLVIASSDHGFGSFRRGVNLNTVLHDLGYLHLAGGARPGDVHGEMLRGIDWEKTRAYALGLGGIYLNRKGREGSGIVAPADADALGREIAERLAGMVDPQDGATAIRRVRGRDEAYSGPCVDRAPDLLVDFAPGYRASWGTSLGGVPAGRIEDNTRLWSGDHIIDPEAAPGVLFIDRRFRGERASLVDLAPTILDALGVPKGSAMEGSSLLS
ncbi:MAG: alkaline phosphatase family protein [Isosphaeraceae bacterium]|nr:alkaline phosphatase family protein [Isosphaeraceae bacterium]